MAASERAYVEFRWNDPSDPKGEEFARRRGLTAVWAMFGDGRIGLIGRRADVEAFALAEGLTNKIGWEVISLCDICNSVDDGDIVDGICADCNEKQESESEE